MRIDLVTIFPRFCDGPLGEGIVRRAIDRGLVDVRVHDLRDYTTDRHRSVDDVSYGGGPGMVFKPEPLFRAVDAIRAEAAIDAVILTSPQGRRFTQAEAGRLAALGHIVVLCGRYEGVDDRVREALATEALSIGDVVLSGGELPALVLIDAVARFLPGVLGDPAAPHNDSFSHGILEAPHYTRPRDFRGWTVPDVLLSGDHAAVAAWRKAEGERRTARNRPDLLKKKLTDP